MTDDQMVMHTMVQISARDGVSKQAVAKAVRKLLADKPDTPVERGANGQILRVSLAHYDHFRQRHVNPAKAKAEIRSPDETRLHAPSGESFDEARRQSEWLRLGRERLRHQEEIGQLLRKDKLEQALGSAAASIQADIRRLANRADDLAMAVSKEGVHGARILLREIAIEIGNKVADHLSEIADAAPEYDELIEAKAE
ncbi:hypothetical protein [Rhizobium sp. RU36D]|uniref:hypothetical protein n=1 Tax=Rhizobium sp. RU36D TaxID=1907415 RepID=UPI0009D8DB24|nr:hypothetical protein [Rhizobium sp. RU36D]SMD18550.1 hypothetical protein SAMN05880593_13527 [Rhizobium sp. RU36D]